MGLGEAIGNRVRGLPGNAVDVATGKPWLKGKAPSGNPVHIDTSNIRRAQKIERKTAEVKGMNEQETQQFIKAEKVAVNLINNEARGAARQQIDADANVNKTDADTLEDNDSHQAILQVDTLITASMQTDEEFKAVNPNGIDYRDEKDKTKINGTPIEATDASGTYQVARIVDKKGEVFVCEVIDANGKIVEEAREFDSGDIIRGEIIAEADAIGSRFQGEKKEIFDMYIDGLGGTNVAEHFSLDGDQLIVYNDKIKRVCNEQGIPTYDDLLRIADEISGYHGDKEPPDDASQEVWKAWKLRQRLRDPLEKSQGEVIPPPEFLGALLQEELRIALPELQANAIQLDQQAKAGVIPQEEATVARLEVTAAQWASKNNDVMNIYCNGILNGGVAPETGKGIINAAGNNEIASAIDLVDQVKEHFVGDQQAKEEWADRAKKVDKRRKMGVASVGLAILLSYAASMKLMGGLEGE